MVTMAKPGPMIGVGIAISMLAYLPQVVHLAKEHCSAGVSSRAWLMWLVAHIYFLINFRNRLAVMIDWAWSYWTYNRGARIIIRGPYS